MQTNAAERRKPSQESVPSPTALKTRNPWRPVQLLASFLIRSKHRSTISLPTEASQAGKNAKLGQDVHSVPDSPMLEMMSLFGSSSSSPLCEFVADLGSCRGWWQWW